MPSPTYPNSKSHDHFNVFPRSSKTWLSFCGSLSSASVTTDFSQGPIFSHLDSMLCDIPAQVFLLHTTKSKHLSYPWRPSLNWAPTHLCFSSVFDTLAKLNYFCPLIYLRAFAHAVSPWPSSPLPLRTPASHLAAEAQLTSALLQEGFPTSQMQ